MASLTITIGPLIATVSADNTRASNLLQQYAASLGATGTNQEKANAVVRGLVNHMREQARQQRGNTLIEDAIVEGQAEIDALSWE